MKFTLDRWSGCQGTICCQEKFQKNKRRVLTIFFLKILWFFRYFFCSFLNFSIKYSSAIAIWGINICFSGSDCIRTMLKFWWPVNPSSLAWCTIMLTTRFLKTFRSIWPITRDTVKLFKNEFDIRYQRQKLHFPTNFQSFWRQSPKSHFFDQNFGSNLTKNSTCTKLTENL